MALSDNERQLADFLQMPAAVVEYAKSIPTDSPMQGVLYECMVREKNARRLSPHVVPLLCVPCPRETAVAHLTQPLPSPLQPYGYMAFIMAGMTGLADRIEGTTLSGRRSIHRGGRDRVVIGIYQEHSWENFLRLQGPILEDGIGWEDIVEILQRWSQSCELVVLGASSTFVTIYFPTVPSDLLDIVREAYYLGCEYDLKTALELELPEGSVLKRLARDTANSRLLTLLDEGY